MVILKFQKNLKTFVSSISETIELIGTEVSQTIDSKVASQQKRYDAVLAEDNTSILEKEYNQVAAKLRTIEQTITIIEGI